jgi:hypothetical protein
MLDAQQGPPDDFGRWAVQLKWTACHDLLRSGFGVEDIAFKLDCTTERVRREVRKLRNSGQLKAVLNREDEK